METSTPHALTELWPHLADLPARMQALLPQIMQGLGAHGDEVRDSVRRMQARRAELWQRMLQSTPPAQGTGASDGWRDLPYFRLARDSADIARQWLEEIVDILSLDTKNAMRLRFVLRQWADATAPENFLATNPDAIERALRTRGKSLVQGREALHGDLARGRIRMCDESAFGVGRNLAVTPGAVVFQNELIQLIQYSARTPKVYRTPVLMVPPFINKYYILDLTQRNSFVSHALDAGFQVFMISWRNIPSELGHLTWDDYARTGVQAALDKTLEVTRARQTHTLGFCVGGTLLSSTLASCIANERVASLTLLASLLDFSDVGDIEVYVDEAFVARTEARYANGGVVPGAQLASAFASLRARELIWKFAVENYLLGDTPAAFDLLYWNSDSANLPGPLFAWYLRNCYLENKLRTAGALSIAGEAVDLSRLRMPAFVLGTEVDHIVPWKSAHASAALLGGEVEFVLGGSGHVAGVISPPGARRRGYRVAPRMSNDAAQWLASSEAREGSWWPHWIDWLKTQDIRQKAAPTTLGSRTTPAIEPAPGRYVKQ